MQADSLPSEPPGGEINQKDKYYMSSLMESKKQTYQTHTKRSEIRLVIREGGDGVRRGVIGKNLIKLYKLPVISTRNVSYMIQLTLLYDI